MWHVTRDTWHVTRDTFGGVNILSKFQLSSSYCFWFMILWWYFRKRMNHLINESVTRLFVGQPRLHRVCQKLTFLVQHNEPISLVELAQRSSSQSILENILLALKHDSVEKKCFHDTWVNFWGVLSENIVQRQKTFFYVCYISTLFPLRGFTFFVNWLI